MKNIKVPGIVWAAVLIIGTWVLITFFPNQPWLPTVLLIASGILKGLEISYGEDYPELPTISGEQPRGAAQSLEVKPRSKASRFLFG